MLPLEQHAPSTAYFFCLSSTDLLKWTNAAVKTLLTFRCKIRLCDPRGQIQWYSAISGPRRLLLHAYWIPNTVLMIWWADAGASRTRVLEMRTCEWAKILLWQSEFKSYVFFIFLSKVLVHAVNIIINISPQSPLGNTFSDSFNWCACSKQRKTDFV